MIQNNFLAAEMIGIMLGDGSLYYNRKFKIYQTRIAGHSENDEHYLVEYVKPLFEKVLNVRFGIKKSKTKKGIWIVNQSKKAALQLISLGFKVGNKKENNIGIPEWIFESEDYLKACTRGIIDTDGSVAPKTPKHPAPSIWITSSIPKLRETFERSLKMLGFHPSIWVMKRNKSPEICLGRREEVLKYYEIIGFNNVYHKERFLKYLKSAPVV